MVDELTHEVIGAAIEVHKNLGPGLLESTYHGCLAFELQERGLCIQTEVPVPVIYKGFRLNFGFRIDLLVEDSLIVELKSVSSLLPVHLAQVITYLKLSHLKRGLLINFNETRLKNGIKRVAY
ncbi:GxxExxY protein [Idiomarina tyrosinivorans]|nr:GxxExxY protein [Idiomarina tyrosinivorans]